MHLKIRVYHKAEFAKKLKKSESEVFLHGYQAIGTSQ